MLQRAASNAYSWWWASHIRTKQSKWLEQSLQDMEEKVANALNLVQKDGDSFAKRAEMYYKHRPELIAFIEESVRAYRALAERYDKLSTDLQKANTTIASVFPDQLQYDTDFDDDDNTGPKIHKTIGPDPPKPPKIPEPNGLKNFLTTGPKKNQPIKKDHEADNPNHIVPKSGLNKEEAIEEIDKLQKDILSMQTMKEFTKSSYENGLAKFWEIENIVIKMQERVCALQDEFKVAKVIDDDDARAIMAKAALNSCEETLVKLKAKHERFSEDARFEHERIQNAKEKLESFKHEFLANKLEKVSRSSNERGEKEIRAEIKESVEELSNKPLTVTEMADTVDKLVNKVIGLETLVSSQTALIERLRIETDDLQAQIRILEDEKAKNLIIGTHNLDQTLKEMEKKLNGVEDLDKNIENQNNSLKIQFTEARCNLENLSENIHNVKPDEEVMLIECSPEHESSDQVDEKVIPCTKSINDSNETEKDDKSFVDNDEPEKLVILIPNDEHDQMVTKTVVNSQDETNWQELLLSGFDDKEKVLLHEYTTILRKYKAAKKEHAEEEAKNQGTVVEMKLQVQELKTLLAKRDSEIQQMKQNLKLLRDDEEKVVTDEEDNIKSIFMDKSEPVSEIEQTLRTDIDAILDENLDFWLRFSSTFHQVQKFKTEIEDLKKETTKVKAKTSTKELRSDINPIYKHLKEIQTELTIWLEQSALLKTELQRRCLSLSNIQEKITNALREGVEEEEIKFSTHQAAKFQGEVLNMQQENTKVNDELQAGLDHVAMLQIETEKTLRRLEDEFDLLDRNHDEKEPRVPNRAHVPLRSFIFGVKSKKQKPSILACINPHKKFTASNNGVL